MCLQIYTVKYDADREIANTYEKNIQIGADSQKFKRIPFSQYSFDRTFENNEDLFDTVSSLIASRNLWLIL